MGLGRLMNALDALRQVHEASGLQSNVPVNGVRPTTPPPNMNPLDAGGNLPTTMAPEMTNPAPAINPLMAKPTASGQPPAGAPNINPFMPAKQQPQMELLQSTADAFQRSFDRPGFDARQAADKAAQAEETKKQITTLQQVRSLPLERRLAILPQLSQAVGQPIPESMMSDQEIDSQLAIMMGQAGIAPDKPTYQFLNQANGGISRADPRTGNVEQVIQPTPDPVKPPPQPEIRESNGTYWERDATTGQWKDTGVKTPPRSSSDSGPTTFKDMTPEELKARGYPEGTVGQKDNRGREYIRNAVKPQSEYTQKQQNDFVKAAGTTDALEGAVRQYEQLVDQYGPQLWTTGAGGDNPVSAKLDAARTNVDIQIKELFNLGVLNGPDLDIIRGAIPDATGFEALGKNPTSVKASLGVVHDYISRARNQIPQQFIDKARPHGDPFTKPSVETSIRNMMPASMRGAVPQPAAQAAQPEDALHPQVEAAINAAFPADEGDADQVPEGWDPEDWKYLTPREKQQALGQ